MAKRIGTLLFLRMKVSKKNKVQLKKVNKSFKHKSTDNITELNDQI